MNTKKINENEVEKSDVARREEEVLAFWNEHDIFNKSILKDAPNGDFVFYDGPPFATGLPHYGHILAGTIKDSIPRFWTMNGYRVRRKWGWDCHGLPLENIIEKRLGLATKRDIESYGVKNFNEAARQAVLEYADDWRRIMPRMGRWADMENDYKTMDSTYTESVWWVFKQLHEKGLVYEGFKSMHLCPRCGTTLSNFEVNQGYKDIKDIAVTVKLPLVDEPDTSLLVWTTTPWTLPGNMAAAVHNDIDYVKVKVTTDAGDEFAILAKARLAQLGTDAHEIVSDFKGSQLVGKSYVPPFNYFSDRDIDGKENAWKIYHADYVELGEEGTGAVHLAPAYGEDDMNLAKAHNIPIVHHVDHDGHFMEFITDFKCQLVKPKDDDDAEVSHLDADIDVVRALKESGRLFKKENITHSYPHCWRCDTPLLNYATTSWFVRVTDIKDKLVAENAKVNWVPDHVGNARFGKWLEGARDWAVSRQRYWGAPLPIWKNTTTGEYKILGSLAEIKQHTKVSGNTYFLMRHGEAESNAKGVSSVDITEPNPLTSRGKEQIAAQIESLKAKNIDLIIASPFERTKMTAEVVATSLGIPLEQIVFDERIGELQLGEFDKRTMDEYHAFLDAKSTEVWCDKVPTGGESWNSVKRRVGEFLYEIEKTYAGKRILIVAHNSPLRMMGALNDGLSLEGEAFDHDEDGKKYENAEVRELPFTPLPHNDNFELDFHRPYIDDVELVDTDGTPLVRVPDVFDCWFESGAMPYAQQHYPFENTDVFEPNQGTGFPANFIAEGLDQTRGWFYSLIVLGTAIFGKSPYQNVIVNGLVLAEDGKKMSKSLQNYPDPMLVADRVGVDSMRFYLLSSPVIRGEDLNFAESGVLDLQRKNLGRLHNVLAMYEMYADEKPARDDSDNVLDRWMIARVREGVRDITAGFKSYELDKATRPLTDLIDDLSVWYLRRSRERLKSDDEEDKALALSTLRFVLRELALLMAPSMPFYAEYLWSRVKEEGDVESVHLAVWPEVKSVDPVVIGEMSLVREFVTLALEARTKANIKVRQPLPKLSINIELTDEYAAIVASEVNVKAVVTNPHQAERAVLDTAVTPELKMEGDAREFMRAVQEMRKEANLQPSDRIALIVQTSDGGEAVLRTFEAIIKATVGADSIAFGDANGKEVVAGDHSFTVEMTKR